MAGGGEEEVEIGDDPRGEQAQVKDHRVADSPTADGPGEGERSAGRGRPADLCPVHASSEAAPISAAGPPGRQNAVKVRANLREAAQGWPAAAHDDTLARDPAAP